MRELKFRIWCEEWNKFLYWGYVDDMLVPAQLPDHSLLYIEEHSEQRLNIFDINGYAPYEKDIIRNYRPDGTYTVEVIHDMEEWLQNYGYAEEEFAEYNEIEIIGNVHENPELIQ